MPRCSASTGKHGRAAPLRRNDELLNRLPKGIIGNLADKARRMGIPVMEG